MNYQFLHIGKDWKQSIQFLRIKINCTSLTFKISRMKEDDQIHFCDRSISLSNMAHALKHRSECRRRETTVAMKMYCLDKTYDDIDDDVFEKSPVYLISK